MYLLCSDWSIRSLEKEKKEEEKEEKEEEENCHLLITARCTNEGRDKNLQSALIHQPCKDNLSLQPTYRNVSHTLLVHPLTPPPWRGPSWWSASA